MATMGDSENMCGCNTVDLSPMSAGLSPPKGKPQPRSGSGWGFKWGRSLLAVNRQFSSLTAAMFPVVVFCHKGRKEKAPGSNSLRFALDLTLQPGSYTGGTVAGRANEKNPSVETGVSIKNGRSRQSP
jgi:hypothetical protein